MKKLMKNLKKKTAAVLTFAMLAALSLTACGGESAEEVIRKGVTEELEEIKNLEDSFLDEVIAELDDSGDLELLGIEADEFCRAILADFDYKVGDITVDGNDAIVNVTITMKDVAEILETWTEDIMALAEDEAVLSMTEDELYAKMGEMLMTSLEEGEVKDTVLDLPYEKVDNVWQGTEEAGNMLANTVAGQ